MRKWKKLLVSLLTVSIAFSSASAVNVLAADETPYTYKVTLSAGNKGTISGQSKIETTDIPSGSTVSFNLNDIQVTDEKYYVKGIRLSGRDNSEALASPAFEVTGDADYVVAYGIKENMVSYTVNYQDTNGNTLAESQTFYGNIGDKPVVAYRYIENYVPQALALTKTLVDNEAENVFTFTYTPGASNRVVETTTTTTVTTVVPGTASTSRSTSSGTSQTRTNQTETNQTGTNQTGTNQTGTATPATPDTNTTDGNTTTDSSQNNTTDDTNQNNTTTSEDEETPKDLVDLDDEETPKANIKVKETSKKTPLAVGAGIIVVAVAALAALIIFLRRRTK